MAYGNLFHVAFFCSAMIVSLTSIVYTKLQKRTDLAQNHIFLFMNYVVLINSATCLCYEIFESYTRYFPQLKYLMFVSQFLYFLVHTALAPGLFYYVMTVNGAFCEKTVFLKKMCLAPFVLSVVLVVTNPITHFVYYFDKNLMFYRNWAELVLYIIALTYFVVAFCNLMLSWNALTRRRRWSLVYFFIITLIGVIIQLIIIDIKTELFGEALALVGVMLSVENEDDRLDSAIGVYNRNALMMDANHLLIKRKIFHVVCLKILNMDIMGRITKLSNTDEIVRVISDYLKTIVPRYRIYHAATDTMLLLLEDDNKKVTEIETMGIARRIHDRFEDSWKIRGVPIKLSSVILTAEVPKNVHTLGNLFYMVDSPMPKEMENRIISGDDLKFLIRRGAVESAVSEGLSHNNYEVYYQPTHCVDGLKLHGAEALIRLHDAVLGDLYPDEFIPIAEQTGYINDIDDFVLKEVCRFIQSGEAKRLGMDCVNVNLSVLQCMQKDFVKHILDIVNSFGIDKSWINFEITESVSASDYELLSNVVKELKENGFLFSMDDYGTGYSNMHSLFELDFDIVKIDKSILWDAEKSELGQIILENCVHMIKQMKRKILVEGVETKEHVEKLKALGVDYLQGYFFSRPITKRELLAYCEVRNDE
ncbi:EAL domain-containing protein [Butyrivibrio sp. YAB3001]|uniref:EAL domain-containing protein n=1 Tax=Butyrivibrio sp. YAB3001 TaxID=1520812 RepID=UPI0008F638B3|nr:EAL domain-containing protein [Butyrivibrio sp. YAB3001]SFC22050.1 EAL domain, c-di-GMP-specific phosphodiesterase class I (or its enzymatically inactive variant) [Butyrivibrio sp. YAB3001]